MVSRIVTVTCILLFFSSTAWAENSPSGTEPSVWSLFSRDYWKPDPSWVRLFEEVSSFETRTRMELQSGHGFGLGDTFDLKFNSGIHPPDPASFQERRFSGPLGGDGFAEETARIWDTRSLVVNTLYDIRTNSLFTPYIGFGLGVAWQQGTLKRFGGSVQGLRDGYDHWLAYQGLMGVTSTLSENLDLGLGYRYLGTQDSAYRQVTTLTGVHNFEVGLRFAF